MKRVSIIKHAAGLGGAHDIDIQGNLAFVAGKGKGGHRPPSQVAPGSFGVVDISDPTRSRVVGHLELKTETGVLLQAETVLPAGPICFVGGTYFWAMDVSEPAHPKILTCVDDPRISSINGMVRRGNTVFAATKKDAITVFDVKDPAKPRLIAVVKPLGLNFISPHDIALLGDDCIVVVNIKAGEPRDRLHVYQVGDGRSPENWKLLGSLDEPRLLGANRILVRGHWAFVACNKGNAIATVDLSDPARPRVASFLSVPCGHSGLGLEGNLLVAAPKVGGLEVYDVSDPEKMQLVAKESFNGLSPDHDIACRDGLAYVTDGDEDQIGVIDLEIPVTARSQQTSS